MLRLLLFLTLTTAAYAQLLDRSADTLFTPPSQVTPTAQQQRLAYLCSLPENANSAACLSGQGVGTGAGIGMGMGNALGTQSMPMQQGMTLDQGTGYDLYYSQLYPQAYSQTYPQGQSLLAGPAAHYPLMTNTRPYRVKEPPTEFQKYVAESIGKSLPIFGASLFDHVPATFLPSNRALVGPDYVIGPDDELQINVWGQLNFVRRFVVDTRGQIVLPDIGPIAVAGLPYGQVASVLKAAMMRSYKNFDLSVTLGRLRSIQIFVVGDARQPGSYTVSSLTTLVNAVFASGGPSSKGSMRHIQLKRENHVVTDFDLYDLILHGDKSKDVQLLPGRSEERR